MNLHAGWDVKYETKTTCMATYLPVRAAQEMVCSDFCDPLRTGTCFWEKLIRPFSPKAQTPCWFWDNLLGWLELIGLQRAHDRPGCASLRLSMLGAGLPVWWRSSGPGSSSLDAVRDIPGTRIYPLRRRGVALLLPAGILSAVRRIPFGPVLFPGLDHLVFSAPKFSDVLMGFFKILS